MNNEELKKKVKELEERIASLENKRITQTDVMNDAIKMRHCGEGVRFIRGGATADKPTTGEEPMQGYAIFFDDTTTTLYVWSRTAGAWVSAAMA